MGTPKDLSKLMRREARMHAAWLPVTNTMEVGDYGVLSGGVFTKMGNLDEFGLGFETAEGPTSTVDLMSEGTTLRRVSAGADVTQFPQAAVEASLSIEFARASSFLVKAEVESHEMQNVNTVGRSLRELDDWDRSFKVVSATYTGKECVVLSSRSSDSKIEIAGKANALALLELGKAEAGLAIQSSKKIGIRLLGKTGVIGLRLFKLSWPFGRPQSLEGAGGTMGTDLEDIVEELEDWASDLEDDL